MQKDRQAGQCGMESVPGTLTAATEFAGLRVVEVDTTTAGPVRKHGKDSSRSTWTGWTSQQKESTRRTPLRTLRNTFSGSILQGVDIQLEHVGRDV